MNPIARKTIEVTRDDIRNGIPYNSFNCPIARAVQRQFPNHPTRVFVTYMTLGGLRGELPEEAIDFIGRFDNKLFKWERWLMRPFTFSVEFEATPIDKSQQYAMVPE
jgi:hypothetical protein